MTKGQRTIATLLVAIAALLTVNIVVRFSDQQVQAQQGVPFDSAEPTVVSVTIGKDTEGASNNGFYRVFRAWSDGAVDMTAVVFSTPSNLCDIQNVPCTVSIIPPP